MVLPDVNVLVYAVDHTSSLNVLMPLAQRLAGTRPAFSPRRRQNDCQAWTIFLGLHRVARSSTTPSMLSSALDNWLQKVAMRWRNAHLGFTMSNTLSDRLSVGSRLAITAR